MLHLTKVVLFLSLPLKETFDALSFFFTHCSVGGAVAAQHQVICKRTGLEEDWKQVNLKDPFGTLACGWVRTKYFRVLSVLRCWWGACTLWELKAKTSLSLLAKEKMQFRRMLLTDQFMSCFAPFRAHLGRNKNMPPCLSPSSLVGRWARTAPWERKTWQWRYPHFHANSSFFFLLSKCPFLS